MPRQVKLPDGTLYDFPDDATDQEISAFLNAPPSTGRTTPEGKARSWTDLRNVVDSAKDLAIGAAKGLGASVVGLGQTVHMIPGVSHAVDTLYGQPGLSENAFAVADKTLEATNPQQLVGKGLAMAAESAIPITAGAKMLPTFAKAGEKFERVMRHAHSMPVDVSQAGDVALRIADLADRGGTMPMVVRKFLKRITDPNQGELTYREARDFASNISRLSADEMQRLTPVLKREVGALREALNASIQRTADIAGKGNDYRSAMTEYRRAARGREIVDALGDAGKKAAITGAVGGAAYQVANQAGLLD